MKQATLHAIARDSWKRGYLSNEALLASYKLRIQGNGTKPVKRYRVYPEPLVRNLGQFMSTN